MARVESEQPSGFDSLCKKNGIPIPVTKKRPWSSDRNLLHISFEGGILEDTWAEAPEEMYVLTNRLKKRPTNRSMWKLSSVTAMPWLSMV